MPAEQVACTGESHTVHGKALCLRDGGQDGVRVTTGLRVLLEQMPALRGRVCTEPESGGFPAAPPRCSAGITGQCCLDNPWWNNPVWTRGTAVTVSQRLGTEVGVRRMSAHTEPARCLCLPGTPGWAGKRERRRWCPWGCMGEAATCSRVPEHGVV